MADESQQTANPVSLSSAAGSCKGAESQWMKLLPQRNQRGNIIHLLARGILARQHAHELRNEKVETDPDRIQAVAALSLISGSLPPLENNTYLTAAQVQSLTVNSFGVYTINAEMFTVPFTFNVSELWHTWPETFPVQPDDNGEVSINPDRWAAWLAEISAGNHRGDANTPQTKPRDSRPPAEANELHPWALAGYHNVDVHTGAAIAERTEDEPAVLQLLSVYTLSLQQGAPRRKDIMGLLVLGVTVLTSGGSITDERLEKIITTASKETAVDNIEFTCDTVTKGWDFISVHLSSPGPTSGEVEDMFESESAVSLSLTMACQQTELKMLTGIVTTIRAVSKFTDFPWQDLSSTIKTQTGVDELAHVNTFANYIEPEATKKEPEAAGGRWSGWTFALRQQNRARLKNSDFPNLLYAAVQLSIQAGGTASLKKYRGLEDLTVQAQPVIDSWITAYLSGQRNQQAEEGEMIQNIRTKHI